MCGIVGFTHKRIRPHEDRIRSATLKLVHRGPDEQGIYESRTISLGAVRLKIIDLESGSQPMFSGDRDTVIIFNGEIYNFLELRRELEGLGYSFHSRSDTEVVLYSYLEWGRSCLQRLRGMFALAIWSESQRRLLLARDRMGIKPLYYCRRGEDIYFASELKAILEHTEIERNLDPVALHHYLSLNYVPAPYTLIQGIEKLRPGYWLEWHNGRVQSEAYWRLNLQPRQGCTLESAVEELDLLLRSSVRDHLIADVPLGVWLSGGLDSSTVLHYASEAFSGRLRTFSVSFLGRKFDESPYFRKVAAAYGTDHHEIDVNPSLQLAHVVEQLPYYFDEPCADAGALPVWYLSYLCRRYVTVALSGEGADELFGGYVTYLADRLNKRLQGIPTSMRRLAMHLLHYWPVSNEKISFEYKLKRLVQGSLLSADEAHIFWNGTFSEFEKQALYRANGSRTADLFELLPDEPATVGHINRYLWFDQLYYLPDDILQKCDRMSMAHSLEVRPPFLDHRIVEFAASLPEHFKVRGTTLKFLLRQLMKQKLPETVLERKKQGFDIPAHDWLRGPLRELLLDSLSEATLVKQGIFNATAVQSHLREHLEKRANLGYHLWGLLILSLWMKRWRIQAVPAAEMEAAESGAISVAS